MINLGVDDPDVQPSEGQRKTLADACLDEDSHHYPSFYSPKPFKEAIANWYRRGWRHGFRHPPACRPAEGSAQAGTMVAGGDQASFLNPEPCTLAE